MNSIKKIACVSSCAFMLTMGACNKKDSPPSEPVKETKIWNAVLGGNQQDEGYAVHKLSDGGYILFSSTYSNNSGDVGATKGDADLWIIRMDADGKKIWQKTYGGSSADYITDIAANPDGSFVGVGYTASNNSGDIGPTNGGGPDIWILKIDANGNIVWNKTYGGANMDIAHSIARTAEGKYLVTGFTYSSNSGDFGANHGSSDCFIAKVTSEGSLEWLKTYGGNNYEEGKDIIANTDGTMVMAGHTSSSHSGDVGNMHGIYDMFFLKLDASGVVLTSKTYGGQDSDYAERIIPAGDGGYVLVGGTFSNKYGDVGPGKGNNDAWIVKVDARGELIWQKNIGGSDAEDFSDVIASTDGGYIAVLNTGSNNSGDIGANKGETDIAFVKISSTGEIKAIKMMGGEKDDEMYSLSTGSDGGYIAAGYTLSSGGDVGKNNGESDLWVVKIKEL